LPPWATRALADLGATGHRLGSATPAGFGAPHNPPSSSYEQARPQHRKTQGLDRGRQGAGTCFHGPGAQGSNGTKTLKGVPLKRRSETP
jgi:hypothetical protein